MASGGVLAATGALAKGGGFAYTVGMSAALLFSPSLLIAIAVLFACQAFKAVLYSVLERRLSLSWLVSAGGMPSAHSAFVTSLAVNIGLRSGFGSEVFAVACAFSVIIIYDSWRLRGSVAHHARILDALSRAHPELDAGKINLRVGHSVPEILAGIAAGGVLAVVAWLILGQA